ncbi:MAG: hypothetical protein COB29_00970 [Sulfitobacter sp.]|nr:MAG: hypothetical protein COB29_00970 [Sulfitobacter sp.]
MKIDPKFHQLKSADSKAYVKWRQQQLSLIYSQAPVLVNIYRRVSGTEAEVRSDTLPEILRADEFQDRSSTSSGQSAGNQVPPLHSNLTQAMRAYAEGVQSGAVGSEKQMELTVARLLHLANLISLKKNGQAALLPWPVLLADADRNDATLTVGDGQDEEEDAKFAQNVKESAAALIDMMKYETKYVSDFTPIAGVDIPTLTKFNELKEEDMTTDEDAYDFAVTTLLNVSSVANQAATVAHTGRRSWVRLLLFLDDILRPGIYKSKQEIMLKLRKITSNRNPSKVSMELTSIVNEIQNTEITVVDFLMEVVQTSFSHHPILKFEIANLIDEDKISSLTDVRDLIAKMSTRQSTILASGVQDNNVIVNYTDREYKFKGNSNGGCWRCGRTSHKVDDCYSSKDVNGEKLADAPPNKPPSRKGERRSRTSQAQVRCPKCNRSSTHCSAATAEKCSFDTHSNGTRFKSPGSSSSTQSRRTESKQGNAKYMQILDTLRSYGKNSYVRATSKKSYAPATQPSATPRQVERTTPLPPFSTQTQDDVDRCRELYFLMNLIPKPALQVEIRMQTMKILIHTWYCTC